MAGLNRIVVCGAAGRMGRRITALASAEADIELVAAIEVKGSDAVGRDAGSLAGVEALGVAVSDDLAQVVEPGLVCLDFTSAEGAVANLKTAATIGAPILLGATGMNDAQRSEAEVLARKTATIIAANVSLGVNLLIELVEEAASRLGEDFDCEVLELHHNQKKDSPSGTALALAQAAAVARGRDPGERLVLAREGMVGERPRGEIGIANLRAGDSAGEHTVVLAGTGERLELSHRALSRDCLAAGALRAARWLKGRGPGLYSMRDVLARR